MHQVERAPSLSATWTCRPQLISCAASRISTFMCARRRSSPDPPPPLWTCQQPQLQLKLQQWGQATSPAPIHAPGTASGCLRRSDACLAPSVIAGGQHLSLPWGTPQQHLLCTTPQVTHRVSVAPASSQHAEVLNSQAEVCFSVEQPLSAHLYIYS